MLVSIDDALAFPKRFQVTTVNIAPRTLEGALSCDKICQWIFLSKDSLIHHDEMASRIPLTELYNRFR